MHPWQRISDLLADALELPQGDRAAFVEQQTVGDEALRAEVESLLAAAQAERGRFDEPAVSAIDEVLAESGVTRPSLAGRRVGAYVVMREVGHGGMGAVYEAVRDDQFRKRVALKTIWRGADSEVIVRRFRQERQILAALAHQNIAALHDGGVTDDGTPYFAMEFVDGEPIDIYCRERKLPIRERLALFRQVCAAVQYAHRNLVVHRDLKPGNILVTADGTVKLVDFGIAKLLDPDSEEGTDTISRAGLHPFTTAYASPEQLRGDVVSTATDVYSLGVVLYQLLSGRAPFGASNSTPGELIALIIEVQPLAPSRASTAESCEDGGLPPLERLRRHLAGELDAIVMMAIRKEAERRYASVEALAEDVRRYQEQLPIAARRDTMRYRVTKFVRRNRLAVSLSAVAMLAVMAGVGAALWQGRIAAQQRDHARAEGEKAARVASFLQGLLGASDVMWNSPTRIAVRNPTVAQALDSAARRLPSGLEREPLIRAALHRTIGKAYYGLARPADARVQLDSALAIHQRELGPDHPETGVDLHYLAYVQGAVPLDSIVAMMRHTLAIFERNRPDTIPDYPPAIHDLAYSLATMGRLAEAESLYRLVIERENLRAEPRQPLLAITHGSLGLAVWNQGRFTPAIDLMTRGIAIFDSLPTQDLGEHGSQMMTLGSALNSANRGREALPYLLRARPLITRLFGPQNPTLVQIGVMIADSYAALGDAARSDQEAQAALRLGESLPKGNEGARFQAEWTYARVLRKQKRFEEAERMARRQYALAQQSVTNIPYFWADATFMLGAILIDRKRYQDAEPYMLDSYKTARDKLSPTHVRTQRVLPGLVMVYEGLRRPADAQRYRALMPDTMRARFDTTKR